MSKNTIIFIVILSLGLIGVSFYLISMLDPGEKAKPTSEITNIISTHGPISDFSLIDTNGRVFTKDSLLGKFSVLYFGFTNCPDICPYSLEKFKKLSGLLDKKDMENVQFIFVSVDPQRDNLNNLTKFVKEFGGDKVIGLTGNEDEISKLTNSMKIYFAMQSNDGKGNYYVDHTSFIYLLNSKAELVSQFTYNVKVDEMKGIINNYLSKE